MKIFVSLPPAPADHSVEEWVEAVVGTGKCVQKFLEPEVSFARAFFVYEMPENTNSSFKRSKTTVWENQMSIVTEASFLVKSVDSSTYQTYIRLYGVQQRINPMTRIPVIFIVLILDFPKTPLSFMERTLDLL